MATDWMLVSRRAPTMARLRAAVAAARSRTELGRAELVGDWDDGDPLVEISAEVSSGELLAQVFRPTISRSTAAHAYTVRIALAPPLDDDGHCWLTGVATAGTATDAQIRAVLDVVGTLAAAGEGFLVLDGEYVPLDGVPEPERLAVPAPPPPKPPRNRAFVNAFFTTPVTGDEGWTWFTTLLRQVLAGHLSDPDLRPRYIDQDGEWRTFMPAMAAPPWWPLSQYLLTPEPYLRWEIDPAWGPADRLTILSLSGDADPDVAESFLPDLVALVAHDLAYALVHAWHDDEPLSPSGLWIGPNGPRMSLSPHRLTEYLPDLYWAQIFGPPWVELFGADLIGSTPAYRVEEVSPGCWLIQLTEHLADVVDAHPAFERARRAAKEHLGADAFYRSDRGPSAAAYRAATIPTLAERGIVERPPR